MYKNWMRKKLGKSGVESLFRVAVQRCLLSIEGQGWHGRLTLASDHSPCFLPVAVSSGMTCFWSLESEYGLIRFWRHLSWVQIPKLTWKSLFIKTGFNQAEFELGKILCQGRFFPLNIYQECTKNAVSLCNILTHSCSRVRAQIPSRNVTEILSGFFRTVGRQATFVSAVKTSAL